MTDGTEDYMENIEDFFKKEPHSDFLKSYAEEYRQLVEKAAQNQLTSTDLFKYMHIINYNFANLSRLVQAIFYKQDLIEAGMEELNKKVDELLDVDKLLEDASDATPSEDDRSV